MPRPGEGSSSIVEYFAEHEGYRCGYCKSEDTNFSHGMWAHTMSTQDYQDLIDRGWRRSGQYCYKPTMDKTCCPMYTIKCQAPSFHPSKSHKKVIKKFNNFVLFGKRPGSSAMSEGSPDKSSMGEVGMESDSVESRSINVENKLRLEKGKIGSLPKERENGENIMNCDSPIEKGNIVEKNIETSSSSKTKNKTETHLIKQGLGPDPTKPKQIKAKLLRQERKKQKLEAKGVDVDEKATKPTNQEKSLEDWLKIDDNGSQVHQFGLRLVRVDENDETYSQSFAESFALYQKYQVAIHGDPVDKVNLSQYKRFLCKSPLVPSGKEGSYHQQYLLNGKIIAVGVVDILPWSVSSVYLYYDPDFHFLSLGTYTSLQEIAFVRKLSTALPRLVNYYLGFYIHSCPKMRYKGQYSPSFLVCPETYRWQSIEHCRPILDATTYSRLDPDTTKSDPNKPTNLQNVKVLFMRQMMPWPVYRSLVAEDDPECEDDTPEAEEYCGLVGEHVAARMLLYRSG